ncbi:MAG: tryptophan-rich sensory protein [Clostridia bacterium]|nr:tryptophan-rich sensory protein [Clostridia bacterium]
MRVKRIDWKALIFFLVYTLGLGFLGGLLGGQMDLSSLNQPALVPPAWLFPVVWTILYTLMAIAAYLVYTSRDIDRGAPLRLYLLQVIVNALWPLFFFRLEWRLFAFVWILLLIALVVLTMVGFKPISNTAFWLMVPYLVWLLFAAYLNFSFYLLNR